MYRKFSILAIIFTIVGLLAGATLKEWSKSAVAAEKIPEEPNEMIQPDTESAPEGWIIVAEEVLVVFIDEPAEKFEKARKSFLAKEYEAAAMEINKAASFLKLQGARASSSGKTALKSSIRQLEKLADDVEKGKVKSVEALDKVFAKAHHSLAKHHRIKATQYHIKNAQNKLGHALKATAFNVERGFKWTGRKIKGSTTKLVENTRRVAGKLVSGKSCKQPEVEQTLKESEFSVDELGAAIEMDTPEDPDEIYEENNN